ncbi:unnamed protein product, partial [Mycena citricolor]
RAPRRYCPQLDQEPRGPLRMAHAHRCPIRLGLHPWRRHGSAPRVPSLPRPQGPHHRRPRCASPPHEHLPGLPMLSWQRSARRSRRSAPAAAARTWTAFATTR